MSKVTISRIFETSKTLATKSGQELSEFVVYMAQFAEQALRALRQGLTFSENFAAQQINVALTHNVEQIINIQKQPVGIIPIRTISASTAVESFIWYINDQTQTVVKANFVGAPATSQTVAIVVLF